MQRLGLPSQNLVHSLEMSAASASQVAGRMGRMLVTKRVTGWEEKKWKPARMIH